MSTPKGKKPFTGGNGQSKRNTNSNCNGKLQKTANKNTNAYNKTNSNNAAKNSKLSNVNTNTEKKIIEVIDSKKKLINEPVYLGYPDIEVEKNDATADAQQTYIGGHPIWLDDTQMPDNQIIKCGGCGNPMYLLVQSYAPLEHRPHERVLYVWGCNRRQCMRKPNSFRALRAVQMNQSYARKLAANKESRKKSTAPLVNSHHSATNKTAMQSTSQSSMGFGVSTQSTNTFSLGDLWNTSTEPSLVSNILFSEQNNEADILVEKLNSIALDSLPEIKLKNTKHEWPTKLPAFKHYWIDIEEEFLEQHSLDKLKEKYAKYMELQSMEESIDDNHGHEGTDWDPEPYEKSWKPKGFDKAFKKFTEIVQENPEQCIRYQWKGNPLLYTQQDETAALLHSALSSSSLVPPPCPVCGAPRIFELQLMPNLLSALATSTYRQSNRNDQHSDNADPLDMGMEWGTIFVLTCEQDCFSRDSAIEDSAIEDGAVRFHEELVLLQHEI
ncbi:programmed cell death protein 2 [Syncephalis fuscata]|nr:programmed cell death protein 2 [Syncephalis fuscata]